MTLRRSFTPILDRMRIIVKRSSARRRRMVKASFSIVIPPFDRKGEKSDVPFSLWLIILLICAVTTAVLASVCAYAA